MIKAVDLERVKRLSRILAGNEKPAKRHKIVAIVRDSVQADPGLQSNIFLFNYKNKFHLLKGGEHSVISDAEARTQIDETSDIELYYICTNEKMCPLPSLFSGKGATALMVKDQQAVIDTIKRITGVTIKKSSL